MSKDKLRSEMTEEELEKARKYHREWNRADRVKNPEKVRNYERKYEHRPEVSERRRKRETDKYANDAEHRQKLLERREAYYAKNADKCREKNAQYRDNPKRRCIARERTRQWCLDHPEQKRASDSAKYTRKRTEIHGKRITEKLECIKYLGGKCSECGCDDHRVLQFHHCDPKQKLFKLSDRIGRGSNMTQEEKKTELDKCVLLCANCHIILHSGAVMFN